MAQSGDLGATSGTQPRHAARQVRGRLSTREKVAFALMLGAVPLQIVAMVAFLLFNDTQPLFPMMYVTVMPAVVMIGGILWGTSMLHRACAAVIAANGWLCLSCRYNLQDLGDRGGCPECGRAFTREELIKGWNNTYAFYPPLQHGEPR